MWKQLKSMKVRLLIPLAAVLLLQTSLLAVFYRYGGVSGTLRDNAVEIFVENTENNKLNIERDIIQRWMNDIRNSGGIAETAEQVIRSSWKDAEEIAGDPELNQSILHAVTDQMIELLHHSYGNGIYLVLNGPASSGGDPKEQAALYIRDMDASSYAPDNSDLLLEWGAPAISRDYRIPLDSFWEQGYLDGKLGTVDFYEKPMQALAGQEILQNDAENYAYLGIMELNSQERTQMLSYSMPLVLSDGTVIGVIGGEMDERRIMDYLSTEPYSGSINGMELLAKMDRQQGTIEPVIAGNALYERYFGMGSSLSPQQTEWDSTAMVTDRNGAVWYAALEPLRVYGHNTPFEDEEWMVVNLLPEERLFFYANNVQRILLLSVTVSLLLSLLALIFVGNVVMRPMRTLLTELRTAKIHEGVSLKRIQITEIDELVDAINGMSANIVESASRISRILDASDVPIGVFEYNRDSQSVFCSRSLLKLLKLPCGEETYVFMDRDEFVKTMQVLSNPVEEGESSLYEFQDGQESRYIRMKLMINHETGYTGILSDVTMEINERRKLERERNYDLLTNIYNRRAFREMAGVLLERKKVAAAAFVMWDLDNLKYVNDTYGHETGDRYIRLFADYLRTLEQDGAVVDRHAGDEFMAVLYNGTEMVLWNRLRNFMDHLQEVTLKVRGGYEIPLRASAGVVWYPRQAQDFDTLVRYADFAMYMSKHSIKGIVQEFDMGTYEQNSYLLSGREELNWILEKRNVQFALQPIFMRDGSIYGYEALMRPELKKLKNIGELLNLAKIQAKLPQFEALTWFGAAEWISSRLDSLEPGTRFFINSIASVSLAPGMIARLEETYGEICSRIVLELTEMEQTNERSFEVKKQTIHRWGGSLALDDYGAGYSNEGILLQMNPDLVKMDLALVKNIHRDEDRQTMAKSLIGYCHSRNIMVVAEGVETLEELEYLMKIGVDLFQGYYLARPSVEIRPADPGIREKMQALSQK